MDEMREQQNGRGKRKLILLAAVSALVISGAFGVKAIAGSKTYAHMMELTTGDSSKHHRRHGGHFRFSEMTDEEVDARIERIMKHLAIEIDATAEQTEKITVLLSAVARDLKPVRQQFVSAREEIHSLLLADSIDREALEKLRVERLAEVDRISKNLVNAIVDAAEVLSPEQRKVLDERIREFRQMHRGRWHRG